MIALASRALGTAGATCVVEAKTGTGKSLAYLCASAPIAAANDRRLVISTGTVALQEQLIDRDIPAFLRATGIEAGVALGKSRQRYLCERNLAVLRGARSPGNDPDGDQGWPRPPTAGELKRLEDLEADFDSGTWDGDLDRRSGLDDFVRRLVAPAGGSCIGNRCAYAKRCPGLKAREALEEADIVVINHGLLLAELQLAAEGSPSAILDPDNDLIVVDEAHQLAEHAITAGARSVSIAAAQNLIQGIDRRILWAFRVGVLDQDAKAVQRWQDTIRGLQSSLQDLDRAVTTCTAGVEAAHDGLVWRSAIKQSSFPWRAHCKECLDGTKRLRTQVVRARERLSKNNEISPAARNRGLSELGVFDHGLKEAVHLFSAWTSEPEMDGVDSPPVARWITRDERGSYTLHASDVTAGPLLSELLWGHAGSVLLTSATLSAGGDFSSLAGAIALPDDAVRVSLPSPFDLERQATLHVPWTASEPSDFHAHAEDICSWLQSDLDWDSGSLVIFTSLAKMRAVHAALPQEMKAKVLMQGTMSRSRLLATHRERIAKDEGSVIFGSNSMGEGLDLAGKLATTVVITQLPFSVPADPVLATRSEWFEARGRRPFDELVIPEAIRVLEQFCGRLIRSSSDHGRIVILDRRLIAKGYGKRILDAMPPFRRDVSSRPKRSSATR